MEAMVSMSISHDRREETIEAKARWFQSLPLSERMELLCLFTDLILTSNPRIVEQKDAQPIEGCVRVLSQDDLIASKRVASYKVDLKEVSCDRR
jgi:hypothetical protein